MWEEAGAHDTIFFVYSIKYLITESNSENTRAIIIETWISRLITSQKNPSELIARGHTLKNLEDIKFRSGLDDTAWNHGSKGKGYGDHRSTVCLRCKLPHLSLHH